MHTSLLTILMAALLLLFGQRLYWLFVGGVGFIVGMNLAPQLLPGQPAWLMVLAAFLVGIADAVLAIFFQRVAFGLAGFLAGGYLAQELLVKIAGASSPPAGSLAFVIGGIILALVAILFVDWALIGISAALGATILASWLFQEPLWRACAFGGLLLLGVAVQSALFRRQSRRPALVQGRA